MGIENATTEKGRQASKDLHRASREEEREVEAVKKSPLAKGADRVNERARSSDGKDAGAKQAL